ncbi:hypothetical protein BJ508DRAFT_334505 [Ascobolus immersus RN42]|uniref:Uncharacterized protein n=1 Tax=Ascobolus immersus RN42 TaxID=1160509 RepID=A0A3N4HFW2_ASCIM|nr:hypothetical protein BJ508DRAFT_334505 [Ascobolus immersus RN42]
MKDNSLRQSGASTKPKYVVKRDYAPYEEDDGSDLRQFVVPDDVGSHLDGQDDAQLESDYDGDADGVEEQSDHKPAIERQTDHTPIQTTRTF